MHKNVRANEDGLIEWNGVVDVEWSARLKSATDCPWNWIKIRRASTENETHALIILLLVSHIFRFVLVGFFSFFVSAAPRPSAGVDTFRALRMTILFSPFAICRNIYQFFLLFFFFFHCGRSFWCYWMDATCRHVRNSERTVIRWIK